MVLTFFVIGFCSDEILDHEYIFQDVKLTEAEEKEFRWWFKLSYWNDSLELIYTENMVVDKQETRWFVPLVILYACFGIVFRKTLTSNRLFV
jgi:hypothetical protein